MATAAYLARFQQPPPVIPEGETLARLESCGGPVLSRLKQLHLLTDPRQLVSSWCRLCSRMLGLGWAGPAFGPDNLTVCGGIRSLLGLFDLRTLDEPEAAEEAIEASLRSLAEGVAQLLEASPVQCLEPVRLEVHQNLVDSSCQCCLVRQSGFVYGFCKFRVVLTFAPTRVGLAGLVTTR